MSFDTVIGGFATPIFGRVLDIFVGAAFRGSVLLLLAWAVTRLLRSAPASLRHLVWTSALGGVLVMPVLTAVVPPLGIAALPRFGGPVVAAPVRVVNERPSGDVVPVDVTPVGETRANRANTRPIVDRSQMQVFAWPDLGGFVPLAWLIGAALLLARLALGTMRLSAWTRRASAVDDGAWLSLTQRLASRLHIARPITLLRSERACVPMTWGVIYPTVLLPIDADEWSSDRRTIVLLHELAHVKRFDAFTQIVAQIATALFWFNPLVWLAARQMRMEREHACDDFVLAGGARPTDYAHDLLQIARSLGGSSAPAAAALAMARRSEFEGRLLAILAPNANRYGVSRMRVVVASALVFSLALPLAALAPSPATSLDSTVVTAPSSPTLADVPVPAFANPTKQRLIDRLGPVAAVALPRALLAPSSAPDRETLIAVVRAAGKMTSDYEKAELLVTVAKHYVRDDELRTAYLDAVGSMHSSYDQSRALLPMMLKDDFPPHAIAQVVKIAAQMSSDNDKATLLVKTITDHEALTPNIRDAMIAAAATINSDYDRGRTVAAILERGGLSNGQTLELIGVIKGMSSSTGKATALVDLSSRLSLTEKPLRDAFVQAAATLSSAYDYRRVMTNILK